MFNMTDAKYGSLFNDTLMQSKTEAERVASANIIIKEKGLKGDDAEALRSAFKTGYVDGKLSTGDNIKEIQRQYIVNTMSSDLVRKSDEFASVRTSVTEVKGGKSDSTVPKRIFSSLFGKNKKGELVLNDPTSLMKEIASSPSDYEGSYNPDTGLYKDVYTDKDGKTITNNFNLFEPSGLISFLDTYLNAKKFKDTGKIKLEIANMINDPGFQNILEILDEQAEIPRSTEKAKKVIQQIKEQGLIAETSSLTGLDVNTIDIDEFN